MHLTGISELSSQVVARKDWAWERPENVNGMLEMRLAYEAFVFPHQPDKQNAEVIPFLDSKRAFNGAAKMVGPTPAHSIRCEFRQAANMRDSVRRSNICPREPSPYALRLRLRVQLGLEAIDLSPHVSKAFDQLLLL